MHFGLKKQQHQEYCYHFHVKIFYTWDYYLWVTLQVNFPSSSLDKKEISTTCSLSYKTSPQLYQDLILKFWQILEIDMRNWLLHHNSTIDWYLIISILSNYELIIRATILQPNTLPLRTSIFRNWQLLEGHHIKL